MFRKPIEKKNIYDQLLGTIYDPQMIIYSNYYT